uniref:Uncharacterized protein n=1 Tax=Magallana gigas TaxID=29159 RepID=A0A8W8NZU2_MAGGI
MDIFEMKLPGNAKCVRLGIFSRTVLQNAESLIMENNVNLFVNVQMFPVILLLDVLSILIPLQDMNHEVVFFFDLG